eukprot:EG_transcript_17787
MAQTLVSTGWPQKWAAAGAHRRPVSLRLPLDPGAILPLNLRSPCTPPLPLRVSAFGNICRHPATVAAAVDVAALFPPASKSFSGLGLPNGPSCPAGRASPNTAWWSGVPPRWQSVLLCVGCCLQRFLEPVLWVSPTRGDSHPCSDLHQTVSRSDAADAYFCRCVCPFTSPLLHCPLTSADIDTALSNARHPPSPRT